ncbi:MAG: hypothetical protein HY527_09315 [Betaproteobacteria bacterium]|nr:hypothetical protein [Betaproteobacteria bacterium]
MTSFLTRNIPPRAILAAGAMTLLVSVVMGRENGEPPAVVALAARTAAPASSPATVDDLDLQKLTRSRKAETIADLFAPRNLTLAALPQVTSAEPAPPPAPSAPPLPFTYLGQFIDGEKTEVFVTLGDEHYSIEKGKTIDGQYKVEKVTPTAVTFVYLPLGTRQSLPIPVLK